MSEKNDAPRGKPSIVRKKASATRPSPVSAEMAATLKQDEAGFSDDFSEGFDDGATVISSSFAGLAAPHPHDQAKEASAVPTPTPKGDYDPKNLSGEAAREPAPTPSAPKTLRKSPAIVKASDLASSKATRPAPAIQDTKAEAKPSSASNPTVETPKLVREELSAKLAAPTPAPPDSEETPTSAEPEETPTSAEPEETPTSAEPASAGTPKKSAVPKIIAAVVGLGAVGGLVLAFGMGGSSEEVAPAPTVVAPEPKDDSVGNLIKEADEQFVAGNLVGDGSALSLLVAARVASPDDERVELRLGPLADKFEELGKAALTAGDLASAAEHFKNSLEADPSRHQLANQLSAIQDEIKAAEEKK